jgi:hypothetical protein
MWHKCGTNFLRQIRLDLARLPGYLRGKFSRGLRGGSMANDKEITKGIILNFMRQAILEKVKSERLLSRPIIWKTNELIDFTLKFMVLNKQLDPPPWVGQNYSGYYPQLKKGTTKQRRLIALLDEAVHDLLTRGVIIQNHSYPTFACSEEIYITQYGEEWCRSDIAPIPEDIEGVISYLKQAHPKIDDIILQYLKEALRAYERPLPFASAVMLGAASEKLFYLLSDSIKNSSEDGQQKTRLDKLINDARELSRLRELVSSILDKATSGKNPRIPYRVHQDCKDSLLSLFNAIRIQRNDAVHPISSAVSEEQLRLLLLAFPHICRKVYDIIIWLGQNQI